VTSSELRILILLIVGASVAALLWHFRDDLMPVTQETVSTPIELPAEEPAAPTGPAHPLEPLQPAETETETRSLQPLPDLDDSDAYFLLALIDVFGDDMESLLVREALIDKIVVTIDNLPRKHVAERLRPAGRLAGNFVADVTEDDEQYYLSGENYARYDHIVGLVSTADIDNVVETYRRFYPLFQESYVRLGYPDAYFNDRVVEVIDHLLQTPRPDEPLLLVRPHVLYEFADPELNSLSAGQKLLLRMGNEHAEKVRAVLSGLRDRIA
jgi:Protein of unknown function (DUF3014)